MTEPSGYNPKHQVTHVNSKPCTGADAHYHPDEIMLAGDTRVEAPDLVALVDAGAVYWMIPPEGADAHFAWKATGLPLMLQTRFCEKCGTRVLFA